MKAHATKRQHRHLTRLRQDGRKLEPAQAAANAASLARAVLPARDGMWHKPQA